MIHDNHEVEHISLSFDHMQHASMFHSVIIVDLTSIYKLHKMHTIGPIPSNSLAGIVLFSAQIAF
jgi:hypothetical protein